MYVYGQRLTTHRIEKAQLSCQAFKKVTIHGICFHYSFMILWIKTVSCQALTKK